MPEVVHVGKECVLDADVASLHCIWEADLESRSFAGSFQRILESGF